MPWNLYAADGSLKTKLGGLLSTTSTTILGTFFVAAVLPSGGVPGAISLDLTTINVPILAESGLNLILRAALRSTPTGATTDTVRLFVNGDFTVTNYRVEALQGLEAAAAAAPFETPDIGLCPTNHVNVLAGEMAHFDIIIPNYGLTGPGFKHAKIYDGLRAEAAANQAARFTSWSWENDDPITSFEFRTDNHSTDLFTAASFVQVFVEKEQTVVTGATLS